MNRYASIWFPYLLADWLVIHKPHLKDIAFVFTQTIRGKKIITATNKVSSLEGINRGISVADAKTMVPDLQVFDEQPGMINKILTELGKWCIRFTPIVSIDLPDGLILDSSGCSHLWGGEKKYISTLLKRLHENGYNCQVAISDTIGTSWAIARYHSISPLIETNKQLDALLPLPPVALRLNTNIIDRLHKLGLNTIGKFIQMPRSVLRRRFGEELLLKIGQALGHKEESIVPLIIKPPYEEQLWCIEPVKTRKAIEIAIKKLLEELCLKLNKEGLGIRYAILKGYRIDGKTTQIEIGTNQATTLIPHLCKLFELKIAFFSPGLGVELFTLYASKVENLLITQEELWYRQNSQNPQKLSLLLDKIAGKIGQQSIRRYLPESHYWPERSLRKAISLSEQTECVWRNTQARPIEILDKPQPILVTAPVPDYPPLNFRYMGELHVIKKADGPERIEREWWLDKGEHRDYYILENEKGQRYWVFRSGHYHEENSDWFLHGFFA